MIFPISFIAKFPNFSSYISARHPPPRVHGYRQAMLLLGEALTTQPKSVAVPSASRM